MSDVNGSVLDEAAAIIHGARQQDYGGPAESFTRIAELWTAYLRDRRGDRALTSHDVALMMILLKVSRARNGVDTVGVPQRDSLVDIIGYAGCSELITEAQR